MNHISLLIVDDDFAKITSIIKIIKEVFTETLSISQASSVQEAIEAVQKKEFHLLITDFQMPLRNNEPPDNNGGITLIKSLYKKRTNANVPLYIVGLTQYSELKELYNGVWKVWHYDSASVEWRNNVRDLIHHISLIKSRVIDEKIETIFVEGTTDKKIIEKTFNMYYPKFVSNVSVDTVNFGAGASWVERQLFIWAKSLTKKGDSDTYLKAIGIFDDDNAGNIAIEKIRNQILPDSAESKTFYILKNSIKYSILLKSIKSKGISFPTAIEDLFPVSLFKKAKEKGWLTRRSINFHVIDSDILKLSNKEIIESNLLKNNFTQDEIFLILNKIDDNFKVEFTNLALASPKEDFQSVSFILKEVLEKFKMV